MTRSSWVSMAIVSGMALWLFSGILPLKRLVPQRRQESRSLPESTRARHRVAGDLKSGNARCTWSNRGESAG